MKVVSGGSPPPLYPPNLLVLSLDADDAAPHYDGHFRRNGKERSMKTFMLYLNGGFEGGSTNFVDECQMLFRDPGSCERRVRVCERVIWGRWG